MEFIKRLFKNLWNYLLLPLGALLLSFIVVVASIGIILIIYGCIILALFLCIAHPIFILYIVLTIIIIAVIVIVVKTIKEEED